MESENRNVVSQTFKEFCDNTSAPGFRYMSSSNKAILGRCFWWALEAIFFVIAGLMIAHTWIDTYKSPLIISLEGTNYPVRKVPFPGVAICNINKISKKRFTQFVHQV